MFGSLSLTQEVMNEKKWISVLNGGYIQKLIVHTFFMFHPSFKPKQWLIHKVTSQVECGPFPPNLEFPLYCFIFQKSSFAQCLVCQSKLLLQFDEVLNYAVWSIHVHPGKTWNSIPVICQVTSFLLESLIGMHYSLVQSHDQKKKFP